MCYFSNEEKRKDYLKLGTISDEDIEKIAKNFFGQALKLQIGCGAEPTLYKNNSTLIKLAKNYGVPYISFTTNANNYDFEQWQELLKCGLDEITISLHGISSPKYEYFMTGGKYEKFVSSFRILSEMKKIFKTFKLRINFTVNEDNIDDLANFFDVFNDVNFDVFQIRPIYDIGDSEYKNFSWKAIIEKYSDIIEKLQKECIKRKITILYPEIKEISLNKFEKPVSNIIESTYFYFKPNFYFKDDYDLQKENFKQYAKRTKIKYKLFKNIFNRTSETNKKYLNYNISGKG